MFSSAAFVPPKRSEDEVLAAVCAEITVASVSLSGVRARVRTSGMRRRGTMALLVRGWCQQIMRTGVAQDTVEEVRHGDVEA